MKRLIFFKEYNNKQLTKLLFLCSAFLLTGCLAAQQPQVYNQFFMNPYIYNPAYAGVEGHATFFAMYRKQWASIDGAPQLTDFSFHVPLDGGIAVGAAAFNISQGLLNTSAAKASAAYLINIDRTHFVRFGMSLGFGMNSVNITEFDSPDDAAFNDFLDQSSFLLGDVGATYHFGHFNVGLAIPNLFSYNPVNQTEISSVGFSPTDNILFKTNYRGHINDDFAFEPHLLFRYSSVINSQFEAALIAHLYHLVWVGTSYRQEGNIIFLGGMKVQEKLGIGFSFELGNTQISSDLGPTFEVNLGYHLGTKKRHAQHTSSFIKSHRLTAEQRARKAALEKQKEEAQRLAEAEKEQVLSEESTEEATAESLKETVRADDEEVPENPSTPEEKPATQGKEVKTRKSDGWDTQENADNLSRVNEEGQEETGIRFEKEVDDKNKDVVISWLPTEEAEQVKVLDKGHLERTLPDGSKEIGIKYEKKDEDGSIEEFVKWDKVINETQADAIESNPQLTKKEYDEIAKGDPTLTEDFRTAEEVSASDQQVVVKRGTHLLELPAGNFVIAGAFSVFSHAEDYSDVLFEEGFKDTIVGYSSARGYYYVVVFQSNSIKQAHAKKNEFRKLPKLSKAWVLQVNE